MDLHLAVFCWQQAVLSCPQSVVSNFTYCWDSSSSCRSQCLK